MENVLWFVIYPEGGVWVAHGLQHNIVAHAESLAEIRDNINILVEAYEREGILSSIPKAASFQYELYIIAKNAGRNLDDVLDEPVQEAYTLELQTA